MSTVNDMSMNSAPTDAEIKAANDRAFKYMLKSFALSIVVVLILSLLIYWFFGKDKSDTVILVNDTKDSTSVDSKDGGGNNVESGRPVVVTPSPDVVNPNTRPNTTVVNEWKLKDCWIEPNDTVYASSCGYMYASFDNRQRQCNMPSGDYKFIPDENEKGACAINRSDIVYSCGSNAYQSEANAVKNCPDGKYSTWKFIPKE